MGADTPEANKPATKTTEAERHHTTSAPESDPKAAKKAHKQAKKQNKKPRTKGQKIFLGLIIFIVVALVIGLGVMLFFILQKDKETGKIEQPDFPEPIYSTLTGEEISDASLDHNPTYCAQIPNGADGRPQAGLTQAAFVFEAIAETGITRFAAVFQNPTTSAIGPIRSLRPYYLDWDTPFDCTIVRAGGSDEANLAINQGGYSDLNENMNYMWREVGTGRTWNNLFTSSSNLARYSTDRGQTTSNPTAFPRLTPDETQQLLALNQNCPEGEVCDTSFVSPIKIDFSKAYRAFNTVYTYDPESNTYYRSFASGEAHKVYDCPAGLDEPNTKRDCGELVQLHPSVVIAMIVSERTMADGYHESITTVGSGNATIFQNGTAIEATWRKASQSSQIVFTDVNGEEIKLTPGQVWIAAVPQYGEVNY